MNYNIEIWNYSNLLARVRTERLTNARWDPVHGFDTERRLSGWGSVWGQLQPTRLPESMEAVLVVRFFYHWDTPIPEGTMYDTRIRDVTLTFGYEHRLVLVTHRPGEETRTFELEEYLGVDGTTKLIKAKVDAHRIDKYGYYGSVQIHLDRERRQRARPVSDDERLLVLPAPHPQPPGPWPPEAPGPWPPDAPGVVAVPVPAGLPGWAPARPIGPRGGRFLRRLPW